MRVSSYIKLYVYYILYSNIVMIYKYINHTFVYVSITRISVILRVYALFYKVFYCSEFRVIIRMIYKRSIVHQWRLLIIIIRAVISTNFLIISTAVRCSLQYKFILCLCLVKYQFLFCIIVFFGLCF